jgi:hypothetical protein
VRRSAGPLALAALLGAAGCQSYGDVTGKVTYKGQPLKGGSVTFTTPGKGSVSAPIGEDGSYTASHVPAGDAKIAVETKSVGPPAPTSVGGMAIGSGRGPMVKGPPKMTAPKDSDLPKDAHAPMSTAPPKVDYKRYVKIPEQFGDPEQSGLTLKVTGGPQTHNIDLK